MVFVEVEKSAAAAASAEVETSAAGDRSVEVNLMVRFLDAWIDFDVQSPHAGSDLQTDLALTVSSSLLSLYALVHFHT